MSIQRQDLNAIDRNLMTDVVGGAGSALSQLATACPTPESYTKSAACKAADAHYVAVVKAITRHPAAVGATVAPSQR